TTRPTAGSRPPAWTARRAARTPRPGTTRTGRPRPAASRSSRAARTSGLLLSLLFLQPEPRQPARDPALLAPRLAPERVLQEQRRLVQCHPPPSPVPQPRRRGQA